MNRSARGIRAAQAGLLVNAALVAVKLVAGVVGQSYALVADAIESASDVFSSLVVWGGLRVASRPADESHPYGHGKAEAIAAAVVALMLLGAAVGIAVAAVAEIRTPDHAPAPFTLAVLAAVVAIKEVMARRVSRLARETGSTAVEAEAGHHRSDALTSFAAFLGIAVAIWGGPGWESADDWAALVASVIIAANGARLLLPATDDLMDRMPDNPDVERISVAARSVEGVLHVEELRVRRVGTEYTVDLHVQADPTLSLRDAHALGGRVKATIRAAVPVVAGVLVHMEPFEGQKVGASAPIDLHAPGGPG